MYNLFFSDLALLNTFVRITEEDERKITQTKKSLFFLFYQILRGVYTSNSFETCFIVANDDLKGKINYFTGFYTH